MSVPHLAGVVDVDGLEVLVVLVELDLVLEVVVEQEVLLL